MGEKTPENNNDHHSTTFRQFMNHIYPTAWNNNIITHKTNKH